MGKKDYRRSGLCTHYALIFFSMCISCLLLCLLLCLLCVSMMGIRVCLMCVYLDLPFDLYEYMGLMSKSSYTSPIEFLSTESFYSYM